MSRELERRLAKMEAKHHADRSLEKLVERMTDDELTAAIRACNARLEEALRPSWREWLAENDPEGYRVQRELEAEGAL